MTLQEALHQLARARRRQRKILIEIKNLNATICSLGGHPDESLRRERDATIYKRFKNGENFRTIARDVGLSSTRVADICKRIEARKARA
jgi:Mor family transcriptional regulator